MKVQVNREVLDEFCRQRGIARLELFGSALREDFRRDSDLDLLCTLRPDSHPTLFDRADMQGRLAAMLGKPVDLVSRRAIERSKHAILSTAVPIYAEG